MDKINLVKEANAVQNIVSTKRIKINHIELDISNEIDKTQSKIYRRNRKNISCFLKYRRI